MLKVNTNINTEKLENTTAEFVGVGSTVTTILTSWLLEMTRRKLERKHISTGLLSQTTRDALKSSPSQRLNGKKNKKGA